MTRTTENQILQHIADGDVDGLGKCLAAYAAETGTTNVDSVSQAAAFMQNALVDARARRAHYTTQLIELDVVRKYMECVSASDARMDLIG